jgi:hypothetical protein
LTDIASGWTEAAAMAARTDACPQSSRMHWRTDIARHPLGAGQDTVDGLSLFEKPREELLKWRSVESMENQDQVFHPSHRPWKSHCDSHIPTALMARGKVESQRQASHFPSAQRLSLPNSKQIFVVPNR